MFYIKRKHQFPFAKLCPAVKGTSISHFLNPPQNCEKIYKFKAMRPGAINHKFYCSMKRQKKEGSSQEKKEYSNVDVENN